ncbi:MAG: nucleotidyltransferase domain-containing protein [Gammaproteobacteria bacterium]|nr:MAG: nucleotidyltransferase domain-containing protein [Gammaproteobacteria bacterium]
MRLSKQDINIIKNTILDNINDGKITLFGSRADDNRKGGDIDLMVETNKNISFATELNILTKLELNGIERKVDLLLKAPNSTPHNIYKKAKKGVLL